MKKILERIKAIPRLPELDPEKPAQRKQIIKEAVKRTVQEYGEALRKLGTE